MSSMGSMDEEDLILSLDCWPPIEDSAYKMLFNRTVHLSPGSVSHSLKAVARSSKALESLGSGEVKSARMAVDLEVYDAVDERNVR